jgi:hypothetical protein
VPPVNLLSVGGAVLLFTPWLLKNVLCQLCG